MDYYIFIFFFNDTATTEIYTLSLHDALPIWARQGLDQGMAGAHARVAASRPAGGCGWIALVHGPDEQCARPARSEDRPYQGICPQDGPLRAAWAGRG